VCALPASANAADHVRASAKSRGATIVLSSAKGAPGDVIRIVGRGFPRRARVHITFAGRRMLRLTAGRRGGFKRSFAVPRRRAGRYLLVTRSRRTSVRIRFRIVKRATSPVTAPVAQSPGSPPPPATSSGQSQAPASPAGPVKLVAAGDIACAPPAVETANACRHRRTAQLVRDLAPDAVATLGDTQYEYGERENYDMVYDPFPSWGTFKNITHPATGNHEYQEGPNLYGPTAEGHFGYFGTAAGNPDEGYYEYALGSWHVFVLNSGAIEWTRPDGGGSGLPNDCYPVKCSEGSPQETWLRARLRALPPDACVIAYWHHPRFSSGSFGTRKDYVELQPVFDALYDEGVELALTAHVHNYEAFFPVTDAGVRDDEFGVRQFVVGTGGKELHSNPAPRRPISQELFTQYFGVLELTLSPGQYEFRFVAEDGRLGGNVEETGWSVKHAGSGSCHGRPAA
jgi:acid phosphatase type 7